MNVKNMGKKDTKITTRKSEEGRNPSGISIKQAGKLLEEKELAKLTGEAKKKHKGNEQSSDPVSNMEFMVGRKLTGEEIYCLNW